jgi:hypothetical protein
MGEVVTGGFITRLDCPPERVLEAAIGKVTDAIVIGWDNDGEFYFASSKAGGPEVLWLLKLAEKKLLEIGDGG